MSCEPIRKLIPLYVEDDLRPRQSMRVKRHLAACTECWNTVEAYRVSQRWLRAAGSPVIAGAKLDELGRAVRRRIDAQPPPPEIWLRLERLGAALRHWALQPAVSMAAVFVVVLGSVAVSGVVGRKPGAGLTSGGGTAGAEIARTPEAAGAATERGETTSEPAAPDGTPAQSRDETEEGGDPAATVAAHARPGAEDALRIEIQTRDPNVRIIWFTPPSRSAPVEN